MHVHPDEPHRSSLRHRKGSGRAKRQRRIRARSTPGLVAGAARDNVGLAAHRLDGLPCLLLPGAPRGPGGRLYGRHRLHEGSEVSFMPGQWLGLPLAPLAPALPQARHQPQAHPRLPAPHQRQGRALLPDPHPPLGARADLRLLGRAAGRTAVLASHLQLPATAQQPQPPDPGPAAGRAPGGQRRGEPQLVRRRVLHDAEDPIDLQQGEHAPHRAFARPYPDPPPDLGGVLGDLDQRLAAGGVDSRGMKIALEAVSWTSGRVRSVARTGSTGVSGERRTGRPSST